MSAERLQYLLDAYAGTRCTEAEMQELSALLQEAWSGYSLGEELRGIDWEKMYAEIMRPNAVKKIPVRRLWIRWAAAASVLLFLGGAYFLFLKKSRPEIAHTPAQQFKNDVAPGGNKAILTLANGQQIILDSAQNGALAQQGNTKILKLANGQLAYNAVHEKPTEVIYNVLTTPNGGQYQLVLPDGSKVWLNAASSIRYPVSFPGKERMVEVTGEAYFEVVHNSKQPFKVKAGDQMIQDIGTAFNVNTYTDEPVTVTSLVEGSIAVSNATEKIMVRPGEQAKEENGKLSAATGNIELATAWRRGIFSFHHTDVPAMMRQLSRWYNVEVRYADGIPKDETFTGDMGRNLTLAQVLHGLKGMDLHFKIEEDKRIVIMP